MQPDHQADDIMTSWQAGPRVFGSCSMHALKALALCTACPSWHSRPGIGYLGTLEFEALNLSQVQPVWQAALRCLLKVMLQGPILWG